MAQVEYPHTRIDDTIDQCAGVLFADPYQWLEEENDEVRAWQRAQASLASDHVKSWPHYEDLRGVVERLSVPRFGSVPRRARDQWFRAHVPDNTSHLVAIVADTPLGEGRVLFDPASQNPEHPPFLSWLSPSPDARVLALGLCVDGSENNTIRLIDVDSGALLPDAPTQVLMDTWLGGIQWLADSSGFFFTGLNGETHDFRQRVFFHRLGQPAPGEPIDVPAPASKDYLGVLTSRCDRWAVAMQRLFNPMPVAVLDRRKGENAWRPFVTRVDGTVAGAIVGDDFVAMTDVNAPRGRIVAIPLDSPTPNDPDTWLELVPESEAAIRSVTPVGDHLYVNELVDTYARVRIFDRTGRHVGEVPLPGKGAVAELPFPIMHVFGPKALDSWDFCFSTLVSSWGTYSHRPGDDSLVTIKEPDVVIEDTVIEDHWAVSADGTRIPYHTVRRCDQRATEAAPTLIYAYGGFNAPWLPQFQGPIMAFVAAGGTYVHGHLRGGGEFGLDWWRGGSHKNKQNCYADLYAIADDLVDRGVTRQGWLGITGGSNGGLLSGVAVTQRPELWRVVVPRVPFLDVIAGCRDPYGRYVIEVEFGDPEDPEEVRRFADFSPCHLAREGVNYPAVYIDAGDTDPRCPPWHARKFAARLQACQSGEAPILLHIWENVGHGWATPKDIQIQESTEWLAFVMQQFGMTPLA